MPLTEFQKLSNKMLDREIEHANYVNARREEIHQQKMKKWTEYRERELKANPNKFIPSVYPDMDMSSPKIVIGIRYVE
jgi:hypothetical protein